MPSGNQHRPLTAPAAAFNFLLTGLWSGLGIAIKYGLEDAPPLRLGWFRFVTGAAVVLIWAIWTEADLAVKRSEWLVLTVIGTMFCFELGFMNIGLTKTTASHAAVLLSTFSIWVAVFSHFQIPGDRLTPRKLTGAAVAYLGIVVIFIQGFSLSSDLLIGDLFILASALVLSEHQVFSARAARDIHIAKLILARFAMGTAVFVALSFAVEHEPWLWTGRLGLSIFYQGIVIAGFGFIANLWLLKRYFPSQIAVISLAGPVCSILLAWALLDEQPAPLLWAGTVLITMGALLVQRFRLGAWPLRRAAPTG